ncbi:hypothetical protein H0H92_000458, partial [Tricholoma furcatifolium]
SIDVRHFLDLEAEVSGAEDDSDEGSDLGDFINDDEDQPSIDSFRRVDVDLQLAAEAQLDDQRDPRDPDDTSSEPDGSEWGSDTALDEALNPTHISH